MNAESKIKVLHLISLPFRKGTLSMSEDHKRVLEQQLWNIANTLRGKMNADKLGP
jgi:hypothetical protein